ncbi:MAG: hypothetical protein JWO30_2018 [Fibrobacteres bacterium]|nr:hypothetical protein [Fibrobacterota bacterium]
MKEESTDINDLMYELHACFGMTYFASECLHRELCNYYMVKMASLSPGMTRKRLEEIYTTAESMTLGKIADAVKPLIEPAIAEQLEPAIEKRNYIAHYFWYEKIPLLRTAGGIENAINQLNEYRTTFAQLDEEIQVHTIQLASQAGVTEEDFQKSLEEVFFGNPDKIEKPSRPINKVEAIINIYDVEAENGGSYLVFETEDKLYWQLCDVGLGWTSFSQSNPGWKINAILKDYTPCVIITRPKMEKWNYELDLGNKVRLCVKMKTDERAFKWWIKKK